MKRSQIVFVSVVFLAVLAGFLNERARGFDPEVELQLSPPPVIALDPLEAPRGGHVLRGEVRDAEGSRAVDVQVSLVPEVGGAQEAQPLPWTVTDDDGRFELAELRAGAYEAVLVRPGVRPAVFAVSLPADAPVSWSLPEPPSAITELPEIVRADLTGRLIGPAGRPGDELAGYEILVEPTEPMTSLSGAVRRRAVTDADGSFRFEGLVAASYRVFALPAWAHGGSWPVVASAELVHGAEGMRAPIELALRTGTVTGRIIDPQARPIEGALVKIWPHPSAAGDGPAGRIWPPVATDATGAFRIRDLPPASYRLRVRAGAADVDLDLAVEADEDLEVPFLPLDPRGVRPEDASDTDGD